MTSRRTAVDPRIAAHLTTLMSQADMSGAQLAAAANVSRPYISEIINGKAMPSEQVARALGTALGDHDGRLVNLVALCAPADDHDPLTAMYTDPAHITPEGINSLARVLSAQRHFEDSVGAAQVIGPVLPQMDTITRLVRSTTGPNRPDLMAVAGQWAQFTGWLHTSLGQWPQARDWNRTALEWAAEAPAELAGELTATVLSYQAHIAFLCLEPGPTIGLSHAALRDRTVYPGQRAYDYYQAAKGHAYAGELHDAIRYADAGDELAADIEHWPGPVPPWQYYREPWLWRLERGLVHLYLNRWVDGTRQAAIAVDHLKAGLAAMPPHMHACDWAAEYRCHLAAAYLHAGAHDTARTELATARGTAEATRSRRILALVTTRERQLQQHP